MGSWNDEIVKMMAAEHRLGWIPDRKDDRDKRFKSHALAQVPAETLPSMVDMRMGFPPAWNQGQFGSCTAQGVVAACGYADPKFFEDNLGSRAFAYWWGRVAIDTTAEDSGAQIRDVIKGLAKWGLPPEQMWIYDRWHIFNPPTPDVMDVAEKHQAIEYHSVDCSSVDEMRACLAGWGPVVFGMMLHESFEKPDSDGVIPMPKEGEKLLGGHCMLVVGYHQEPKLYIVRNSWGTGWGAKGHCYIPYALMSAAGEDGWVVHKMET